MKKKLMFMAAVALMASTAFAQLSTRENDATVERISARPEKGDMALTFAFDLWQDAFSPLSGANPGDTLGRYDGLPFLNRLFTGDLLTYKCYLRDNLAVRGGIRLYRNGKTAKGQESDSSAIYPSPVGITEAKAVRVDRDFILAGGVERHFSRSNIFDVYAAADVLLGFGLTKTVSNVEFTTGDYNKQKMISSPFKAGAELLTGFNIFIAHLPVSVGMEYGLSFIWTSGSGKTKVHEEAKVGTTSYDITYSIEDDNFLGLGSGFHFDKLSKSEFDMNTNQSVRVTVNIYFSKEDKTNSGGSPVGTQY